MRTYPYRITLIIGAGANKDIHPGIGLGKDLLNDIYNRVTDISSPNAPYLSQLLNRLGIDGNVRNRFVQALKVYRNFTANPSIDDFLHKINTLEEFKDDKTTFNEISKISIIFHILGYEGSETKTGIDNDIPAQEKTWFASLWNYLNSDEFKNENTIFNIITFNYDRILEYYLLRKIEQENISNPTSIINFINDNIFHTYGRIGWFNGLNQRNIGDKKESEISFGMENHHIETISELRNHIDLIYNERNSNHMIKNVINESNKIIIMGFAFDYANNIKLGFDTLVGATAKQIRVNLFKNENPEMREKIQSLFSNIEFYNEPCKDFLKKVLY